MPPFNCHHHTPIPRPNLPMQHPSLTSFPHPSHLLHLSQTFPNPSFPRQFHSCTRPTRTSRSHSNQTSPHLPFLTYLSSFLPLLRLSPTQFLYPTYLSHLTYPNLSFLLHLNRSPPTFLNQTELLHLLFVTYLPHYVLIPTPEPFPLPDLTVPLPDNHTPDSIPLPDHTLPPTPPRSPSTTHTSPDSTHSLPYLPYHFPSSTIYPPSSTSTHTTIFHTNDALVSRPRLKLVLPSLPKPYFKLVPPSLPQPHLKLVPPSLPRPRLKCMPPLPSQPSLSGCRPRCHGHASNATYSAPQRNVYANDTNIASLRPTHASYAATPLVLSHHHAPPRHTPHARQQRYHASRVIAPPRAFLTPGHSCLATLHMRHHCYHASPTQTHTHSTCVDTH
ncbi:hypothetical protein Pcinc_004538 [Petrolisthes cinctipes]|uniref:Uncharacterized protein n=1 Tax=Petrolisthes cinctipes TaxID=88211 RepID=A0AAE1L1E6_PETCI|nr:hypothetical protein Pcinc_004538 [Petrolisthes cinctipes]